jgi:hypothetical protein
MDYGLALASEPAEGNVMKRKGNTKYFLLEDGITYNKCWVANGFGHSWHSVLGYSC